MKSNVPICLCNQSALEMWRRLDLVPMIDSSRENAELPLIGRQRRAPRCCPSSIDEVSRALPWGLSGLTRPVHVLVDSPGARRDDIDGIACHACTRELPGASLADLGGGALTCTPGLFLLQLSRTLTLARLAMIAYEACGTYALSDLSSDGFRTRPSLYRAACLRSYVGRSGQAHGVKAIRKILPYVLDGSASPMETAQAMLLHFPYHLGGFGLPRPRLNQRIRLSGKARSMSPSDSYVIDLYWPDKKVACEYDGIAYHTGEQQIVSDSRRRHILNYMGIEVVRVTRSQIQDREAFAGIAELLARPLGVRIRPRCANWLQRHLDLRRQVLSHHS